MITMLVVLTALGSYAQDSYRETLKEYLIVNGQLDEFGSAFKSLNSTIFQQNSNLDFDQLADRYIKECLADKMTVSLEPAMKESKVTEADLKQVISLLSTAEGKQYNEHFQAWTEKQKEELTSALISNLPKAMLGDTSVSIQLKDGIDSKYISRFKDVMGASIQENIVDVFGQISSSSTMTQLPESTMKGMQKWISANVMPLCINAAYGIITDEDLSFCQKLYSQDFYHKTQGSINMMGEKMSLMGQDMFSDYMDWMQQQGAVVSDGAAGVLKMIMGN